MLRLAERDEVAVPFNELQVIEFYARCGSDEPCDRVHIRYVVSSRPP